MRYSFDLSKVQPNRYQFNWNGMKTAQAMKLSIDTLQSLAVHEKDAPGQSYMFEGTYWAEVKRVQGLKNKAINDLLDTFYSLFSTVGKILKDEPIIKPLSPSDIDSATTEMIRTNENYRFQTWAEAWDFLRKNELDKYSPQLMWVFTDAANVGGLTKQNSGGMEIGHIDSIKKYITSLNVKIDTVAPLMIRLGLIPKNEYQAFKVALGDLLKEVNGRMHEFWERGWDKLGNLAARAYTILSKENKLPGKKIEEPPSLPFIDENAFLLAIKKHFPKQSITHFFNRPELRNDLIELAEKSHRKQQVDKFETAKRHIDEAARPATVRPGATSFITILARPFNPQKRSFAQRLLFDPNAQEQEQWRPAYDFDDPRFSIAVPELANFANALGGSCELIVGGCDAAALIQMHLTAIQMQIVDRPDFWHLFQDDLDFVPNSEKAIAGINILYNNSIPLPPPFKDKGMHTRSQAQADIIRQVGRMRERTSNKGRILQERHYQFTPEELQDIKKLRTNPDPEHPEGEPIWSSDKAMLPAYLQYQVRRDRFPGNSYIDYIKENDRLFQFVIDITAANELLKSEDNPEGIPAELLKDLHLHPNLSLPVHVDPDQRQEQGISPLGWVGGYVDMDTKTMWVLEIQSDVMQHTGYMRDPAKVTEERQQRRIQLEQQISQKENQIEQAKKPKADPRATLKQKINKIRGENTALENQQGTLDPNSPQFKGNQRKIEQNTKIIENLQRQIEQMPETVGAGVDEARVQQLQNELATIKNELNEVSQESAPAWAGRSWRHDRAKKYHDYRNKVEKVFDGWTSLFFNILLREAKRNGLKAVNVATAQNLMSVWGKVCKSCGEDITPPRDPRTNQAPPINNCPHCGAPVMGAGFARPETKILFERVYNANARKQGAAEVKERGKTWWHINMTSPSLRVAKRWFIRYKF